MPFAAHTHAASRANSGLLMRQSHAMTTPRFLALSPSSTMSAANACVAQRTTWTFIRAMPAPMTPRRPAVPNSSGPWKRLLISSSSPRMASSSAHSSSERAGLSSQRSNSFL